MSVRQALLALLEHEPMHGYQLRAEFERRTGGTWPLNVGQVYTTLGRLERDELVEAVASAPDGHDDPRRGALYRITPAGRQEVRRWFASPVPRTSPPRDELAIKLALAVTAPGVDVAAVIQKQRSATMASLRDYTRLKREGADSRDPGDLAWGLVLDSLVFSGEAEIRWLDHCEARLRRVAADRSSARAEDGAAAPRGVPTEAGR